MSSDCTFLNSNFPAIPLACCGDTSVVKCDSAGSRVISLIMGSMQLTGGIPSGISTLTSLQTLHMEINNLTGPIPDSVGGLTSLLYLDVHQNQLSGPIPDSVGNLKNLQQLNVDGNALSGQIPASIGQLTMLAKLNLHQNQLSGTVDLDFRNLTLLKYLDLSKNPGLNGTIRLPSCNPPSGSQGWNFGTLSCTTDPPPPLPVASSNDRTPLPLSPSPSPTSLPPTASPPVAAIVGSAIGAVILLCALGAILIYRKRASRGADHHENPRHPSFGQGSQIGLTDLSSPTGIEPPLPSSGRTQPHNSRSTGVAYSLNAVPTAAPIKQYAAFSTNSPPAGGSLVSSDESSDTPTAVHASYRANYNHVDAMPTGLWESKSSSLPHMGYESKHVYSPLSEDPRSASQAPVPSTRSKANYEAIEFHDASGIEIELNVGDRIQLIRVFDGEKAEGKNETTGAVGVLPIHKIRPIFQGSTRLPTYTSLDGHNIHTQARAGTGI
ncbi:uncharacterized protein BJ171DRAFT_496960 [Polychytrium aggregatum]|uniref:uncharacterized protein n=1 Tax=Polychytrium aggregatum TaxID=110093 RepID=UPI0022FE3F93|nr:uncharacterized protein BJ171DRAFT_496960 [Polychytrium aggregatum]KAI9206785.1 hypothetical protein BJ171DRAFT_496960 [Polychytrium aggregatum]